MGDVVGRTGIVDLGQAAEGIIGEGGSDAPGVGAAQDVAGGVVGEGEGAAVGADFLEEVAQVVVTERRGSTIGGGHLGEAVVHVIGVLGHAAEGVHGLLQKSKLSDPFDFLIYLLFLIIAYPNNPLSLTVSDMSIKTINSSPCRFFNALKLYFLFFKGNSI